MSKNEKLTQRLLSIPKDFTWEELVKLLALFGYTEIKKGKTGGARRKFADDNKNIINLHKPHPSNTLPKDMLKKVIGQLKEKGYIQDE